MMQLVNSLWLVSYIVLWILVIIAGLVILALSREIESLHKSLNEILAILSSPNSGKGKERSFPADKKEPSQAENEVVSQ